MDTVAVPPPTIQYTPVGDDVIMASIENSKHTLSWERASGAVYRDADTSRAVFLKLSEHLFHVVAGEHFGGDRDADHTRTVLACGNHRGVIPATCALDGAGWQAACDCGHGRTGWQPTKRDARRVLAAHITKTRTEATARPLDLGAIKRAGVRIPTQRNAS